MFGSALSSRMARRVGVLLLACAIVPLLVSGLLMAHAASSAMTEGDARRLEAMSRGYAAELTARLGAAEVMVDTLTAADAGGEGAHVKQQIVGSRAFKSVVIVPRNKPLPEGMTALHPSPAQELALETGQTVLLPVALEGKLPGLYLCRLVLAGEAEHLAYFELAPDWIWGDPAVTDSSRSVAVVDADGRVLHSLSPMQPDLAEMFTKHIGLSGERSTGSHRLGWQASGAEWHGMLTIVVPVNERVTGPPWAVVVFERQPGLLAHFNGGAYTFPLSLLLAALVAMLGAVYLSRRYVPALARLSGMITALQNRDFTGALPIGADEPRALIEAANVLGARLDAQFQALETFSDIDRLLLGPAELEHTLDAILSRVKSVTHCHSVGITLRDADAPGRGRVYLAVANNEGLPVTRVALDEGILSTLAADPRGLTIARCEDGRHSFLRPLEAQGAAIFWVWPVLVGERLEAILAVGFRDAPTADPQIARYGSEFAARLAVALSKNARDERLYRQAHYDPLTSLPNRLLFRDRLAQELTHATAGLSRGALLYIDLDHFKRVNDSVGHDAGDQLLTIVAQRLRSCVKDGDTVARLGGDEFTIVLRNVADPDSARSIAERIIESVQLPVNIAGRDHYVCASIGITLFPDDGTAIEDLMRNADTAMYRAKELGRGRTMFFDRQMAAIAPAPTQTGLHRALRRREFSLLFQPQFSVTNGELAGVEALLRWQSARDGMRQPGDFVPAAEESGLIVDIGGWVLEAACAQLASWRERGIAPPKLAINVSAQQLKHAEFTKSVRRMLDKYALPAELLELELTESVLADAAVGTALERLAQLGVRLALDDFGTGYSSLSYLRQHPISSVKIDRVFLEEVPQNPSSATLVDTMIVMAHTLGKQVVAEGIETAAQLEFLRERHCDVAQGFFLARPLTAPAVTELLQARIASTTGEVRAAG